MVRKLKDWYWEWEDELIAVLEQPELAAHAPAGYRQRMARRAAELSAVERQQLLAFTHAYRGRTVQLLSALVITFTLLGVLLHLLFPDHLSWPGAVVAANMLGLVLMTGVISSWFSYRHIMKHSFRRLKLGLALGVWPLLLMIGVELIQGTPLHEVTRKFASVALPTTIVTALVVGLPLYVIAWLRNRQHEALTAQLQRDAEAERLARELSESQLRLLRAQIEPHFLFNTLGAVQQLAEHGAPKAAELTANLIAFLRASLSDMRSDQVSLDTEFGLVEAYLRVMQVRLGARLRIRLSLPADLAQARVPSMILLTLAENAIKHGIEPALRGGEVLVSAEAVDGTIRLRVQDSGVGMSATPGEGMGLDNVRRRLQLAHGDKASLALHDADPGLIADITIAQS
jgi:sensor histidine kinase YesM